MAFKCFVKRYQAAVPFIEKLDFAAGSIGSIFTDYLYYYIIVL